jgi:hypothetical protein
VLDLGALGDGGGTHEPVETDAAEVQRYEDGHGHADETGAHLCNLVRDAHGLVPGTVEVADLETGDVAVTVASDVGDGGVARRSDDVVDAVLEVAQARVAERMEGHLEARDVVTQDEDGTELGKEMAGSSKGGDAEVDVLGLIAGHGLHAEDQNAVALADGVDGMLAAAGVDPALQLPVSALAGPAEDTLLIEHELDHPRVLVELAAEPHGPRLALVGDEGEGAEVQVRGAVGDSELVHQRGAEDDVGETVEIAAVLGAVEARDAADDLALELVRGVLVAEDAALREEEVSAGGEVATAVEGRGLLEGPALFEHGGTEVLAAGELGFLGAPGGRGDATELEGHGYIAGLGLLRKGSEGQ